jgi:hypothetical protein
MQIRYSLLILTTLVATCVGEDLGSTMQPPAAPPAGSAWLGCSVSKPAPMAAAPIPMLPPGMGFVIQNITPGGPAEAAQLKPLDVLWKFGDQMLVNQGQLAALLSLKRPGDEVALTIFRASKPLEIKIKLGTAQDANNMFSKDMIDAAILSDEGRPMKIINLQERTATFSNDDGKALVRREGDGYKVVIKGPDQQAIYDGMLPMDGNLAGIPADWHRRICVLRRSLDHALESRIVPVRPPRPRTVPPPVAPPADTSSPSAMTAKP